MGDAAAGRSAEADPTCLFCRIVAGEIPATKIHEDDLVIGVRDIAPRAPTHVLFLSRVHIRSAVELTDEDGPLLGRLYAAAADFARAEGIAENGYRMVTNVGAWGGQTVDHLHIHLLGGRSMAWPPRMRTRPAGLGWLAVLGMRRLATADVRRLAALGLAGVLALGVRRLAAVGLAGVLALGAAGCGIAAHVAPIPSASPSPTPILSDAVRVTQLQVESALRSVNLAAIAAKVPFRPGESPALTDAPRLVLQAVLPTDPDRGFLVVYDFPDPSAAYAAGLEMAAYLASGPGRVQFPTDAEHVLRQLGSTLVFYSWSPSTANGPAAASVAAALSTLGSGIPIPR